jgi:drug/metabolite transporter (DMT)-like permease
MLVSGSSNSLLTKYQDLQCVANCDGPDSEKKYFEQAVFQTVQMFIAEMACWGAYAILKFYSNGGYQSVKDSNSVDDVDVETESAIAPKLKGKTVFLLAMPTCCDIVGTTLMNIGLLFIPVSVYQMTRGSIVLFVGCLSTVFLKHSISRLKWIGLWTVFAGVFVVGFSTVVQPDKKPVPSSEAEGSSADLKALAGVLMIVAGQLFTASQFVLEEHILSKYALHSVKVVAWEGTFGTIISIGGSFIMALILGSKGKHGMFDLPNAVSEVFSSTTLVTSSVAIMISLATFNCCGLGITRSLSATSRSTVDTCRTVLIWLVSLGLGWESFRFLQLLGFAMLVYGTLIFNGVVGSEPKDELLPHEFEHT